MKDGFTATEVEEAKKGYLQSREVSRAQDGELAGRLNNYLFLGRTTQWDADLDVKIRALTPAQSSRPSAGGSTGEDLDLQGG